jgi:hypothetical protein
MEQQNQNFEADDDNICLQPGDHNETKSITQVGLPTT